MNTAKKLHLHSESSAQTEQIGRKIGQNLQGGEIIELVSDVGGGKTTLVRGIAEGAGSPDAVSSPTFTVSKQYVTDKLRIVHYDFYRLSDPGILTHELAEVIDDPSSVIIIEWADIVANVLPARRLTIVIRSDGEDTREFTLSVPQDDEYILKGLEQN